MDVREMARSVIEAEQRSEPPFGVYVLPATDPRAELGRSIEREVFLQYFGNSPELLGDEYRDYEANSTFICVLDHRRGLPAGVMRLVVPTATIHSKTLDDIEQHWPQPVESAAITAELARDAGTLWDLATLAVSKDYRGSATGGLISLAIFQAIGMLATHHRIRWLVAIIDLVVLDLVQPQLHHIWTPIVGLEPRRYLDSGASLPIYCDLPAYCERLAGVDPSLRDLLFGGVGLESAVSSPEWAQGIDRGGTLAAIA